MAAVPKAAARLSSRKMWHDAATVKRGGDGSALFPLRRAITIQWLPARSSRPFYQLLFQGLPNDLQDFVCCPLVARWYIDGGLEPLRLGGSGCPQCQRPRNHPGGHTVGEARASACPQRRPSSIAHRDFPALSEQPAEIARSDEGLFLPVGYRRVQEIQGRPLRSDRRAGPEFRLQSVSHVSCNGSTSGCRR